ncbi:unnamed protein product [Candida verbasci]|uniref:Small ribosomal subunit protein uS10 domain-containing protein n=1 Tax=Candida verbasci TaxID=1227364 RepID=A0A9W4TYY2_9ASCO|nr:unnamed protein product [Candida verbasci]
MIKRRFHNISRVCKFQTPKEYIKQQNIQAKEDLQLKQDLLNTNFKYDPKILSSNLPNKQPINLELLNYKPLRLPKTHGDIVADLELKSYDELDLKRIGDFALRVGYYLGIPLSPLTKLKTEKRLYTVIKSPFAQAKSKQNFHRITFNYKIIAYDSNPDIIDLWLSFINKYNFNNVKLQTKIASYESLDYLKEIQQSNPEYPQAYQGLEDPVALKVKELLNSEEFKKHM